ncbi:XXLT1-like protein [Mya arenaria]|uniref:XXLT1-like protein n=1 Tax=Mya arenaria TaxID=6604 RepID=A0ABY7F1D3_MYAAR|nr:XXLT1-like protein [Mya arenaria]
MSLLRSCKRIFNSFLFQISVALLVLLVCIYFYNVGSTPNITALLKSEITKTKVKKTSFVVSDGDGDLLSVLEKDQVNIMITFTNAKQNGNLQNKFRTTVRSLFHFTSKPVNLFILGDEHSEAIAKDILAEVTQPGKYVIASLVKTVHEIVSEMQKYFSYKPGAYFSDSLFFLSIVVHQVIPDLHRVIMIDCDLKFNADILELYNHFEKFDENNVMGIARDAQPVYRHNLHMYRNKFKNTRAGGPPPDGLTGFNSGVLLLDLDRMRKSRLYNSLINAESIKNLTEKYMFKGHLGDQDFYALISLDHEELFYVLPCTWNRQLCTWWRDHGYADVFDQYFKCEGHINIYHGNCNTEIPKLDWERSS